MTPTSKGTQQEALMELQKSLGESFTQSFPLRQNQWYAYLNTSSEIVVYIGTRADGKNIYANHTGRLYVLGQKKDKIPILEPVPENTKTRFSLGSELFPWILSLADRQITWALKASFENTAILLLAQYYILLCADILDRNGMETTIPDAQALIKAQKYISELDKYPQDGYLIQSKIRQSFQTLGLVMDDIRVVGPDGTQEIVLTDDVASDTASDVKGMLESLIALHDDTAEAPREKIPSSLPSPLIKNAPVGGNGQIVKGPALTGVISNPRGRFENLTQEVGQDRLARLPIDVKFIRYTVLGDNIYIPLTVKLGNPKSKDGRSAWAIFRSEDARLRSSRMAIRVWADRGGYWDWESDDKIRPVKEVRSDIDYEPAFAGIKSYKKLRVLVRYHLLRAEHYMGRVGSWPLLRFRLGKCLVEELQAACQRYPQPISVPEDIRGSHEVAEEHSLQPFIIYWAGLSGRSTAQVPQDGWGNACLPLPDSMMPMREDRFVAREGGYLGWAWQLPQLHRIYSRIAGVAFA